MFSFTKMHGAGNDFIVVHDPDRTFPTTPDFVARLCAPHVGIACDGLILVRPPTAPTAHFRMDFVNPDGSPAGMCGNGARCAARFAHDNGLAPASMRIETAAGLHLADILHDTQVRITFPSTINPVPKTVTLSLPHDLAPLGPLKNNHDRSGWGEHSVRAVQAFHAARSESSPYQSSGATVSDAALTAHFLDTGVPHAVLPVPLDALPTLDLPRLGSWVRHHPAFAPSGTNVDFIARPESPTDPIPIRTYERGVEAETLACGTGITASALVAIHLGWTTSPATLITPTGFALQVTLSPLTLTGPTATLYTATLSPTLLP